MQNKWVNWKIDNWRAVEFQPVSIMVSPQESETGFRAKKKYIGVKISILHIKNPGNKTNSYQGLTLNDVSKNSNVLVLSLSF